MSEEQGKVAFITGAARGQGRANAVRLAQRGYDIIAVDVCKTISGVDYPLATKDDLDQAVKQVRQLGRRIVAQVADVRDFDALDAAFQAGYAAFGRLDVIVACAGVVRLGEELDPVTEWTTTVATNLNGTFHTVRVAQQAMIDGGRGGTIVITSSVAGLRSLVSDCASHQAYDASKAALVAYAAALAGDLGKHRIRVHTIHPSVVATGMVENATMRQIMADGGSKLASFSHALPMPVIQPEHVADLVEFLVSERAEAMTGTAIPIDAGALVG